MRSHCMSHQCVPFIGGHCPAQDLLELIAHCCHAIVSFDVISKFKRKNDDGPKTMPCTFNSVKVNAKCVPSVCDSRAI